MNFASFPNRTDANNPYAPKPRPRRVVPPTEAKVHAARVRFIDAKRAAVETGTWDSMLLVRLALDAWIAAEREARAT